MNVLIDRMLLNKIHFDFKKSIIIAHELLYNDRWDENLQDFAVQILFYLKEKYPIEWNSDWRYDAFLGTACDITLKYDDRYKAYKQAYDKASEPPPELLIELARCAYCPGQPPVSYEKAIELLKRSIEQHPYRQAAELLKSIYASKKDLENETYWSHKLEEIQNEELPSFEPSFIKERIKSD